MKNVDEIVKILKKDYSHDMFAEKHDRDPYKVLVACILSLRTKDEVTYPAAQRLFKLADTPKKMVGISLDKVQKTIYPVGFYKRKSKTIKEISKRLIEEYKSKVPDEIDELLKFKGVGRKTANIVVTFGHNKLGIAVDVHVHRISNRLGWVNTKTPEETEFALRKKLPKQYWLVINELMVRHGQKVCRPISPFCSKCKIRNYCEMAGFERKR